MIELYLAPSGRAKKALDEVIPAQLRTVPKRADFVVHAGTGTETTQQRMFAANRGAMLVHLPEAYNWLQQRVMDAASEGEDLVIVDAGLLTMKVAA